MINHVKQRLNGNLLLLNVSKTKFLTFSIKSCIESNIRNIITRK